MQRSARSFVAMLVVLVMSIAICITTTYVARGPASWAKVFAEIKHAYPTLEHMSAEALARELNNTQALLLVDVRTREEYEQGHLPGAIRAENLRELPANRIVVAYCAVGWRSAAWIAQHKVDAVNLQGGIFVWAQHGFPLVAADGVTPSVHPYNAHWGQLLNQAP